MFTLSLLTAGVSAFAGAVWGSKKTSVANETGGGLPPRLGVQHHLLAFASDDQKDSAAARETTAKGGKKGELAINGRVLDPEGQPVAGARVHLGSAQKAVSDAKGQFQFSVKLSDFPIQVVAAADGFGLGSTRVTKPQGSGDLKIKLVKDLPIAGHITDPEGRPVAGATIRLLHLWATPEEDLSAWLETVKKRKANSLYDGDYFKNILGVQGLPQTLTTDQAGRFRLTGVGRERMLIVTVGAPKFQYDMIGIITRPAASFQVTDEWKLTQNVHGVRFDHILAPSRAITGTVRDIDSGKPIAGVRIIPESAGEYHSPEATTDQEGKYRIDSLPGYYMQQRAQNIPAPGVVALSPKKDEPYLRVDRTIQLVGPRDEPLVLDFNMKKGIWVTAKVVDKATGKPVAGAHVEYYPLRNNPHSAGLTEMSFFWAPYLDPHRTGPDGIARVPILPGPGLLGARTDSDTFLHMEPLPYAEAANVFSGIFQGGDMHNVLQGIVKIDAKEAKPATYEIGLDSSRTLTCAIVGPDAKPLTGCRLYGAENGWPPWSKEPLAGSEFTVKQLAPPGRKRRSAANLVTDGLPAMPRTVIVLHPEKKLVRLLELKGDEKGPLTVKLEPAGTITGRLLDPDGKAMPRTCLTIDFDMGDRGGLTPHFPGEVTTDAEGRFRVDGLVPGATYFIMVGGPPIFVGEVKRLKVQAGESKDLGEVKYKPLPQNPDFSKPPPK